MARNAFYELDAREVLDHGVNLWWQSVVGLFEAGHVPPDLASALDKNECRFTFGVDFNPSSLLRRCMGGAAVDAVLHTVMDSPHDDGVRRGFATDSYRRGLFPRETRYRTRPYWTNQGSPGRVRVVYSDPCERARIIGDYHDRFMALTPTDIQLPKPNMGKKTNLQIATNMHEAVNGFRNVFFGGLSSGSRALSVELLSDRLVTTMTCEPLVDLATGQPVAGSERVTFCITDGSNHRVDRPRVSLAMLALGEGQALLGAASRRDKTYEDKGLNDRNATVVTQFISALLGSIQHNGSEFVLPSGGVLEELEVPVYYMVDAGIAP